MKANEPMIGDWVELINPKGGWICNSQIDAKLFEAFLRVGENGFLRFAPIPLTVEILKANGIKDEEWDFYDGFCFNLFNKGITLSVGGLWFVHELQHALRLCGMNDRADKFKLK